MRSGEAVFTSLRGKAVSNTNLGTAVKRTGIDSGTLHGWRSVFADWCADLAVPRVDRDLREAALAHTLPTVEASYRRETGIEARRPVMQRYSEWLIGVEADVIQLPKRA